MTLYRKGSPKSEVVRQIQKALKLYPDGIFGILTEEAVKEFQEKNGLKADGIVGPATLAVLLKKSFSLRKSKRYINELIVHCSATPEGCDYTVEDIRKWHKSSGWSDIGYHYVVYRNGTVVNGRDVDLVGAHCAKGGHNQHSIGICYIGGVENKPGIPVHLQKPKDTRTEAQKMALLSLLIDLKKLYPSATIWGHHDFDKGKDCPSFDARAEYKNL
jgi:N-acetylmuramoyl-L-alanine amidase